MFIGLLLTAGDNDILPDTLAHNTQWCDAIYSLSPMGDGAGPIVAAADCDSVILYEEYLPVDFWLPVRDGIRGALLRAARIDYGDDNWYLLLHADEVVEDDPRDLPSIYPDADGFWFRLPVYVPRDPWDDSKSAIDQMRWRLEPGWPEVRMFKDGPGVMYDPTQHFRTEPAGLRNILEADRDIGHYPYRSPDRQRAKAAQHMRTGFDPDNYRHIIERDEVVWSDEKIAEATQGKWYKRLVDTKGVAG
jgi:hypothetical protein